MEREDWRQGLFAGLREMRRQCCHEVTQDDDSFIKYLLEQANRIITETDEDPEIIASEFGRRIAVILKQADQILPTYEFFNLNRNGGLGLPALPLRFAGQGPHLDFPSSGARSYVIPRAQLGEHGSISLGQNPLASEHKSLSGHFQHPDPRIARAETQDSTAGPTSIRPYTSLLTGKTVYTSNPTMEQRQEAAWKKHQEEREARRARGATDGEVLNEVAGGVSSTSSSSGSAPVPTSFTAPVSAPVDDDNDSDLSDLVNMPKPRTRGKGKASTKLTQKGSAAGKKRTQDDTTDEVEIQVRERSSGLSGTQLPSESRPRKRLRPSKSHNYTEAPLDSSSDSLGRSIINPRAKASQSQVTQGQSGKGVVKLPKSEVKEVPFADKSAAVGKKRPKEGGKKK